MFPIPLHSSTIVEFLSRLRNSFDLSSELLGYLHLPAVVFFSADNIHNDAVACLPALQRASFAPRWIS